MKNKKLRSRLTVLALVLVGLFALVAGALPKPPANLSSQYLTETIEARDLTVSVSANGQITSIDDNDPKAVVLVSEYDIAKVHDEQHAEITIGALDQTISATVNSISDRADSATGVKTYAVTVNLSDSPKYARVGMSVSAEVVTSKKKNVLVVPVSAITEVDGTKTVKTLIDNQLTTVEIETGLVSGSVVEVTSGLVAGAVIVTGSNGTIPSIGGSNGFMPPAPGGVTP